MPEPRQPNNEKTSPSQPESGSAGIYYGNPDLRWRLTQEQKDRLVPQAMGLVAHQELFRKGMIGDRELTPEEKKAMGME